VVCAKPNDATPNRIVRGKQEHNRCSKNGVRRNRLTWATVRRPEISVLLAKRKITGNNELYEGDRWQLQTQEIKCSCDSSCDLSARLPKKWSSPRLCRLHGQCKSMQTSAWCKCNLHPLAHRRTVKCNAKRPRWHEMGCPQKKPPHLIISHCCTIGVVWSDLQSRHRHLAIVENEPLTTLSRSRHHMPPPTSLPKTSGKQMASWSSLRLESRPRTGHAWAPNVCDAVHPTAHTPEPRQ